MSMNFKVSRITAEVVTSNAPNLKPRDLGYFGVHLEEGCRVIAVFPTEAAALDMLKGGGKMQYYIEQLNDDQFGLLCNGRIIAVFGSFKDAKLVQLTMVLKELTQ